MFENLSQKLTTTLRKVRGQGRLTETNIDDSLKEVKMALLEADVNFRVVKAFLKSVKSRAIGEEVFFLKFFLSLSSIMLACFF